jgi:hypothetical protein
VTKQDEKKACSGGLGQTEGEEEGDSNYSEEFVEESMVGNESDVLKVINDEAALS